MLARKRVAIIGAGSSGICAAKYALENELEPTLFEKASKPGGLWVTTGESHAWHGLNAILSQFSMTFLDHMYPKNSSIMPSLKEVENYLLSYMEKFNIGKHIRLKTLVESVHYLPDKKWQVNSIDLTSNKKKSETFDFLIMALGLNAEPQIPKFDNMNSFKGLIIHSSNFDLDERLKDKHVVVIGAGVSSGDICTNLVGTAKTVTNIFRRPYLIAQRFVRFKSELNENKKNSFHIAPMDCFKFRRCSAYLDEKSKKELYKFKLKYVYDEIQTNKEKCNPELYCSFGENEVKRETISDNYIGFVKQGMIKPKRSVIKRFESDGVILEDGTFEKADVVIFCTGYNTSLKCFDSEIIDFLGYDDKYNKTPFLLYRSTFHPNIENFAMICQSKGLFFIGAELQCKWASLVFSGKFQLPSKQAMEEEINLLRVERETKSTDHVPTYPQNTDKIAKTIGVMPDLDNLKESNKKMYSMIWNNLPLSYNFVLNDQRQDRRENGIYLMKEVDRLTWKEYILDDDDCKENQQPSVLLLASKFAEANPNYKIPFQLFRT